jgi:hypothetical protein
METMTMEKPTTEIEARRDMSEYFDYWKSITKDNAKLDSRFFLLHDLILGRDPKKGAFSPITSKNKLTNGCRKWQGLEAAASSLLFWYNRKDSSMEKKLIELSGLDVADMKDRISKINYE